MKRTLLLPITILFFGITGLLAPAASAADFQETRFEVAPEEGFANCPRTEVTTETRGRGPARYTVEVTTHYACRCPSRGDVYIAKDCVLFTGSYSYNTFTLPEGRTIDLRGSDHTSLNGASTMVLDGNVKNGSGFVLASSSGSLHIKNTIDATAATQSGVAWSYSNHSIPLRLDYGTFNTVTLFGDAHYVIPAGSTINVQKKMATAIGGSPSTLKISPNSSLNITSPEEAEFRNFAITNDGEFMVKKISLLNKSKLVNNGSLRGTPRLTMYDAKFIQNGVVSEGFQNVVVGTSAYYEAANDQEIDVRDTISVQGVLTHSGYTAAKPARINFTTNNVSVESGGEINANNKGLSGFGPGTGSFVFYDTVGGTHGGNGGNAIASAGYGSVKEPTDVGTGGAKLAKQRNGGAMESLSLGGGAIRIMARDQAIVNGNIGAIGQAGQEAGGSGGSIWLSAKKLSGSGSIIADGGKGAGDKAPGGGGGRISLTARDYAFSGKVSAFGEIGSPPGGAGTLFIQNGGRYGNLFVRNRGVTGSTVQPYRTDLVLDQIFVTDGAHYGVPTTSSLSLYLSQTTGTESKGALETLGDGRIQLLKDPRTGGIGPAAPSQSVLPRGIVGAQPQKFAGSNLKKKNVLTTKNLLKQLGIPTKKKIKDK